jgi:uncharacterized protein YndB with AHSA1/START domain
MREVNGNKVKASRQLGITRTGRSTNNIGARAVADLAEGLILASVEITAAPERVFQALASNEITEWWVRPGVFDTREWTGDVHQGGRWRAAGMTRGQPYVQEGEFLEVEPPRRLVHTWESGSKPGKASTVTYLVEPLEGRTRGHPSALGVCLARHVQCVRDRMGNQLRAARRDPGSGVLDESRLGTSVVYQR